MTVYEDQYGVPTIKGSSELDVAFVQGYIHARDRFFQMDYFRKVAQGRLGEMVGSPALGNDVQLRTLGLERAALATWQEMEAELKGIFQAYANGVNAWLRSSALPPEYAGLEITEVEPWTPLDTIAFTKLMAWSLAWDLDIEMTIRLGTYQGFGEAIGFDGTALFFEDTHRVQPADGRVTVPGFLASIGGVGQAQSGLEAEPGSGLDAAAAPAKSLAESVAAMEPVSETTLNLAIDVFEKFSQSPLLRDTMRPFDRSKGSNEWAVSGVHTASGYPLVANDPHLSLNTPATFHESNLVYDLGEDGYSVGGVMFPGVPGIIQGCNDWICFGSTVNPLDVSDVFLDQVLRNALTLPTHTVHSGVPEPLQHIYQSFFVNVIGDGEPNNLARASVGIDAGGISFVAPRRNNGPILGFSGGNALINQFTGWGPTQDNQFGLEMNRATNIDEFKAALRYFAVGSQNWIYADVDGNIAYFAYNEVPVRADLAAGTLDGGVPPMFIRDGTGALNHEWLPVANPQPNQALPFEILPFEEMPQVVNPAWGYIANANNDPVGVTLDNNPFNQLRPGGNGLYYLDFGYSELRVGRVDRELQQMVASGQPVTVEDMTTLQANNQPLDAELMLPTLLGVMSQVPVTGGSPMAQALALLADWDYSTPTGIAEGWGPGDDPNLAVEPDASERRNAAAATVFAMWRSMLIRNTIDATLTAIGLGAHLPDSGSANRAFIWHLLNYGTSGGVGASGINFFSAGLGPTVAGSLQQALELLASDEFAPAFANSTDPMDYAWGKLHRIVFDHPLNVDPLNIPNGGGFSDLAPDLPGLARPGAFEVVDDSDANPRANTLNGFMFTNGPNRRFVGEMTPDGVVGHEVIPGGQSGLFYHPNYASQLPLWLTNRYHDLAVGEADGQAAAVVTHTFNPGQ
ncbi:MAG: penicillin acylase family protein [Lysobacterales bacterium]